jgi:hypothetical protein
MSRLSGAIVVVVAGLILASSAGAAPVYTCGFEPSEGFAPGNLDGQGAWDGVTYSPATVVQSGVVHDGIQAARATAEGAYDETFWWKMRTFAVATTGPEVTVSQYLMITHRDQAEWLLTLLDETQGDSAAVLFDRQGRIYVGSGGTVQATAATWAAGSWCHLSLTLHYASATFDAYLNDVLIARDEAMTYSGSLAELGVYCDDYVSGTAASLYYDSLVVSVPPEPGDANDDGVVDAADASILGAHWRQMSGADWEDGDFNNDNAVDDKDAAILAANWSASAAERTPPAPEPSTLVLLLIGAAVARFTTKPSRRLG